MWWCGVARCIVSLQCQLSEGWDAPSSCNLWEFLEIPGSDRWGSTGAAPKWTHNTQGLKRGSLIFDLLLGFLCWEMKFPQVWIYSAVGLQWDSGTGPSLPPINICTNDTSDDPHSLMANFTQVFAESPVGSSAWWSHQDVKDVKLIGQ